VFKISSSVCNTISDLKSPQKIFFCDSIPGTSSTACKTSFIFHYGARKTAYCLVTWNCGRRYLEQYRTASRYHAVDEKPEDRGRDVHCPLVLRTPSAPLGSLSSKISSLHRRPGSSVLPATADFSAATHNSQIMRYVVKDELVKKRNPFLSLLRKHSKMLRMPCNGDVLSAITDHVYVAYWSSKSVKFSTEWWINYCESNFSSRLDKVRIKTFCLTWRVNAADVYMMLIKGHLLITNLSYVIVINHTYVYFRISERTDRMNSRSHWSSTLDGLVANQL